jgi:signal transduction histidine kinase
LSEDQAGLRRDCDVMIGYINEVADNVRRLSRDLRPSILEDLGLLAAIQWLVDTSTKHSDIEGLVNVADVEDFFSQETQIIIYRIIQECLTNTAKHAEASKVFVSMEKGDSHVFFRVEDNGKGFHVREVLDKDAGEKGLGLAAMYERTRMVGGSLDIWSQEGEGTRVTFTIPLKDQGSRS